MSFPCVWLAGSSELGQEVQAQALGIGKQVGSQLFCHPPGSHHPVFTSDSVPGVSGGLGQGWREQPGVPDQPGTVLVSGWCRGWGVPGVFPEGSDVGPAHGGLL